MRVRIRMITSTEHAALLLICHALTVAGNLTVFCWGFFILSDWITTDMVPFSAYFFYNSTSTSNY